MSTANLATAICQVMAAVRYIPETGENKFHRYKYASDEDLLGALQPAMAAAGLALVPTSARQVIVEHTPDQKGKGQWRTELEAGYVLIHTSGESLPIQWVGVGIDGEDKGTYKAMTGVLKYLLRHLFLVPTGSDPERHTEVDDRQSRRSPEPAPPPAPTPAQHDHAWENGGRARFFASIADLGIKYDHLAAYCEHYKRPRPSGMTSSQRGHLAEFLHTGAGAESFRKFLDTIEEEPPPVEVSHE